ncbi:hypothetical protein GCM10010252_49000 [Streptomyces aureoverticillatus]|nr:hypothetical protein GCM10010252_49000 [Streptomyces aureoverticillatus]
MAQLPDALVRFAEGLPTRTAEIASLTTSMRGAYGTVRRSRIQVRLQRIEALNSAAYREAQSSGES